MHSTNEGIYVWNARGDQQYLSDGTPSGLDEMTMQRKNDSTNDARRVIADPQCSQLICNPKTVTYHIKNCEENEIIDGIICRGICS